MCVGACRIDAQFVFLNTNLGFEFLSQLRSVLVLTIGSSLRDKGHSSSAYLAGAFEICFIALSSN